jgi:FkbM family methyltransferase
MSKLDRVVMMTCETAFSAAARYRHHVLALGVLRGVKYAAFPGKRSAVAAAWKPSPHPVWLRPGTSDFATFKEVLREEEYNFQLDKPPNTIIDAGANIGLTAVWFSVRYPDAKIIAVEAERSNYDLLIRNVAEFPNVVPVHAALWSHRGMLAVDDPAGAGEWAFQTTELEQGAPAAHGVVESLTVRDLMTRYNFSRIDLLKVDIEGAEQEVFADPGAPDWLFDVDAIVIELHDRFRPGCSRAFFNQIVDFPVEKSNRANTFVSRRELS